MNSYYACFINGNSDVTIYFSKSTKTHKTRILIYPLFSENFLKEKKMDNEPLVTNHDFAL